jgi:hypothetical protein
MLGVLNEYPIVPVAGGLQAQLGDAYAEERRRVVFELAVPRLATLGVVPLAEVVVRYVSLGDRIEAHELRLPLTVNAVSADEARLFVKHAINGSAGQAVEARGNSLLAVDTPKVQSVVPTGGCAAPA